MDNVQIVVGSKECPIRDVWSIIGKCTDLYEKWSDCARGLGIDEIQIKEFRQKKQLDKISYSDLIFELLELWMTRAGDEATLAAFLQVLEEECQAVQLGESIRVRFKLPCTSPRRKYIALGHSIPDRPSYYIGRTLITRNIISSDIFEHNSKDIFLIEGMDRLEMGKRVKDKLTGVSNEQLNCNKIEPRFIVLKLEHHFERICAKTNNPVHLLRKEGDGRLRWIKSNGDITYLQGCIDHSQDELDEEAFCRILANQKDPVCISDSPGMGKSLLLAEIGGRLTRMFPNRSVSFITLTELIKIVKQCGTENEIISIAEIFKDMFGWTLSKTEVDSEVEHDISFELLLDGFDELDSHDHQMTYNMLRTIQDNFKSIRLWVTSRPHLLAELERHLNQLGINIRGFQMEDQVSFLCSYWTRKKQLDKEKCQQFATSCLVALKSKMNSTDQDIAGIPLQCLLIGESYAEDVSDFASLDNNKDTLDGVYIEFGTISNLYQNLIKKKILKYKFMNGDSKLDEQELMTVHTKLGWELIFPHHVEEIDLASCKIGEKEVEQVLKVGIMESLGPSTVRHPRFLHRTFAEYFIAWYVVDQLEKQSDLGDRLPKYILRVLESQSQVEMRLNSYKFVYPVITYFIDFLIPDSNTFPGPSSIQLSDAESFLKLVHCCTNANYANIFNMFLRQNTFHEHAEEIFNAKLIYITIWNSSLGLLKPALDLFELHHEFNVTVQVEAIRTAIQRGKYSILEFLLKSKGLLKIVKEVNDAQSDLMHDCVENSKNNSELQIEQKVLIIRMLFEINPSLLHREGGLWKEIPLLSFGVHIRLLKELIILGADVIGQDTIGNTLLHMNYHRSHLSSKDYHDLVLLVGTENLKKLVNIKGEDQNTPLMSIFRWMSPTPETIRSFKAAGASFNSVDSNGDTVLEIAIENGRTTSTLINLGAKLNRNPLKWLNNKLGVEKRPKGRTTLLHHAARNGNLEALEMLLEDRRLDVNAKNENDLTPLDYAMLFCNQKGKFLEVAIALRNRGGTFRERVGPDEVHPFHLAVRNRNLELLRLLLHLKVDVNMKDGNGNTALHLVALNYENPLESSIDVLLNMFTCAYNNVLYARTIIEAGADPTLVNNQGKTPLEIALTSREATKEKVFFESIAKVSTNLALKFSLLWAQPWENTGQVSLVLSEFVDSIYRQYKLSGSPRELIFTYCSKVTTNYK